MTIPLVSFHDLKKDALIVDVRQPEEIVMDPVNGSMNVPLPELSLLSDDIPEHTNIALLCATNIRSRKAALYLQKIGFKHISILDRFSF